MRWLAIAAMCVLVATAASANPAELRLGAFVLPYDDGDWRLLDLGIDSDASARRHEPPIGYTLICKSALCGATRMVSISVRPAGREAEDCPTMTMVTERNSDRRVLRSPLPAGSPLELARCREFSACRAYTPAADRACGVHDGLVYRFATGANFGCSGIQGVEPSLFDALIAGLRPADGDDGN